MNTQTIIFVLGFATGLFSVWIVKKIIKVLEEYLERKNEEAGSSD